MNNEFKNLTNEELILLEQSYYDDEINGEDVWYERDKILWEMNRRGMMDRKPNSEHKR